MFSHGFMSFAAIGVTVACLLIMGTFTLVAYNANENLADLQQENAIVAFVDETLEESEARALQTQIESTENVADCTFVSRTEARDARSDVAFLHFALVLDALDEVILCAGIDVEIRAQLGVHLQPILVVGLDPVDLAIVEGKVRDSAEHLVVIAKIIHAVILSQALL